MAEFLGFSGPIRTRKELSAKDVLAEGEELHRTLSVRRETGRWQQMQVLYVEDLANHDDPEFMRGHP